MEASIKQKLEELRINKEIIEVIEDTTDIVLTHNEQHILSIGISDSIAYELYCCGYLKSKNAKLVTVKEIMYENQYYTQAYEQAGRLVKRVRSGKYDKDFAYNVADLVCFICCKINDFKYANLESIEDVTEPIPLQVFIKLLNKNKRKLDVYFKNEETEYAGKLLEVEIENNMLEGLSVNAKIEIISKGANGEYVQDHEHFNLNFAPLVSSLEDLGLQIVERDSELYNRLTERGRKYVDVTLNPKYCYYSGEGYSKGWQKEIRHRIDSRIMVDISAFKMLNSNIDSRWFVGYAAYSKKKIGATISDDKLWMCSPVVYCFAFNNKTWCRVFVNDISEIEFSENAFEDLIIPEENKMIYTAALTNNMPSLDSISNKGAGKIFLLYGAPGVGKTMSAESVAEYLQKPLYYVSVGELGTDPEQLERSLNDVMRIAESWDAIILLDEVDVFAINRIGASIERNAMTAIFLRMLERYNGIMFMTTNLKDNLDPAFISRATATIKYAELTAMDRESIWLNILKKAESLNEITIDPTVYDSIKEHAMINLNGRTIKNTIRLAYCLALSTDKVLKNEHIISAMKLRG